MRRRRGVLSPLHHAAGNGRTTLRGDLYAATNAVGELCNRVAVATVPLEFSKEQLIDWLFLPDAVAKLRAVKGIVNPSTWRSSYTVQNGVNLSLDFQPSSIVTPINSAWQPQPGAHPFLHSVDKLKEVYHNFMKVMHVMNWMDANATPGAIRHYWPTMLSLAPHCVELNEASTFRYVEPAGISPMLPLLRETATLVASALLLPKYDTVQDGDGMIVTIGGHSFDHEGISIATPQHPFRLVHAKAP